MFICSVMRLNRSRFFLGYRHDVIANDNMVQAPCCLLASYFGQFVSNLGPFVKQMVISCRFSISFFIIARFIYSTSLRTLIPSSKNLTQSSTWLILANAFGVYSCSENSKLVNRRVDMSVQKTLLNTVSE
jgi:hypothetical protein